VAGGGGADRIDGEQGGDVLRGGRGADELHGGPGRDTCRASSVDRTTSCEVRRGAQRTMLRRSRGQ
jgi:Ca2+-binding RTX toxin-like protein